MGCLSLIIQNDTICDITSTIDSYNTEASLVSQALTDIPICYFSNSSTPLSVSLEYPRDLLGVSIQPTNTNLEIVVGLVCQVDLGYEFFDVEQGHLIVEEGYLKVRRKEL